MSHGFSISLVPGSLFLAILAGALSISSCSEGPPPPPPPTDAHITFVNDSNSGSTYDIVLDGVRIGAISPQQSISRTVVPNVEHDVRFQFANSGSIACQGSPILAPMESLTLSCDN